MSTHNSCTRAGQALAAHTLVNQAPKMQDRHTKRQTHRFRQSFQEHLRQSHRDAPAIINLMCSSPKRQSLRLGQTLANMGPTRCLLGAHLGQLGNNLGPIVGQPVATLGQHGPTWGKRGPTWVNLRSTWGQLGANLGQHGPS